MDAVAKIGLGAAVALGAYVLLRPKRSAAPSDLLAHSDLIGLDPTTRKKAEALLGKAAASGLRLVVTDGFRSLSEQAKLYAQGRTEPGPIVTHAKPGTSWHNYGRAFDVAPFKDGKPYWPNSITFWNQVGLLGESLGLKWGGRWPQPDRPHFEYHPGLTIGDMQS